MPKDADKSFYEHANAHIALANQQILHSPQGPVSASMMYATARFNASLTATGYTKVDEMRSHRTEVIDYFVREYRLMLEEHMDDYIKNFEPYMKLSRPAD